MALATVETAQESHFDAIRWDSTVQPCLWFLSSLSHNKWEREEKKAAEGGPGMGEGRKTSLASSQGKLIPLQPGKCRFYLPLTPVGHLADFRRRAYGVTARSILASHAASKTSHLEPLYGSSIPDQRASDVRIHAIAPRVPKKQGPWHTRHALLSNHYYDDIIVLS